MTWTKDGAPIGTEKFECKDSKMDMRTVNQPADANDYKMKLTVKNNKGKRNYKKEGAFPAGTPLSASLFGPAPRLAPLKRRSGEKPKVEFTVADVG